MVQIGEASDSEKPRFASLLKNQSMETITLDEALGLFNLPRLLGKFEEQEIVAGVGKFGPYIRHQNKFYSLKKGNDNPLTLTLEDAITLITEKRERDKKKIIKQFPEDKELQILNGRWGPYIQYKKENFRIPKNVKPEDLTRDQCLEIVNKSKEKKKNSG
jgi:DNA topoisomerase-1